MNLLRETLDTFGYIGISPDDVLWVGSADGTYAATWQQFAALAEGVEYDPFHGAQQVAIDLVIACHGWCGFVRTADDAGEGWTFEQVISAPQTFPAGAKPLERVSVWGAKLGWETVASLHETDSICVHV